mmetsp:Transcript_33659/g.71821  ORF Transcript_33659/g.71821 Transcript_33659/m.71821 type:complete len:389 (-) Transcript_33659:37-1203(-)|eukprot:CAMPEP_0183350736 /NCGR_PEP_ID=MMETSP0164_2-20130417/20745_1 /TAXON_ID=221442 /ORGANISM="Coccolithus pelagicus ssp braarudi, Strain PLY182g" /LENGTH=388 /DNA_ID=CAMNT_0025522713 /DNA_START=111 /DNA_END=1277 /DNA_ORIENTATION=+
MMAVCASITPTGIITPVVARDALALRELRMRRLGRSEIHVSEVCLGGMTWGSQNSNAEAREQLSLAFDFGCNFVDTAESYPIPLQRDTYGLTDMAIGKWLKGTRRPRDSVVISSKVSGYNDHYTWMRKSGEGTRLTKEQIVESVEGSLRRLGTDYVDVLQLHWPDRRVGLTGSPGERVRGVVPFDEQVEALGQLIEQGKVREWGLSNENDHGVREFLRAAADLGVQPPVCVQNAYSLLQRQDELELIPKALEGHDECAYLAYSPLSGGVLTGKYAKPINPLRPPKVRSRLGLFRKYKRAYVASDAPKAVAAYMQLATKHRLTPSQLAIAHCCSRDFVTSTIVGASSMTQLAENLMAFRVPWTQALENDILAVYRKYPDPWRVQVRGGG